MNTDDLNLDQRLSRFEAQLDRFSLALHQWQQQQTRIPAAHSAAPDVDQRIRTIEETLDRETAALRRLHEEPLKELQAHVAALKEICVAAASSVRSLDHSESRLAAIQSDVSTHLGDLSRALQILVADLRVSASTALSAQGSAATWPLERIVHLHDELRRTADREGAAPGGDAPSGPGVSFSGHSGPDTAVSAADAAGTVRDHDSATSRRLWLAGAAAFAVLAVIVFLLEQRIERRLNDAGQRVAAAERQAAAATQLASQQVVVAREEANRQISQARDSALRAETVGAILTAPDLIRFNLMSTSVDRSSAQVLWSRTRGVVLSASRLPAAPPNTSYQLWLKTSANSVSAGVFVPDATGRATLVTDVPPKIVGAVLAAEVTLEPSGGATVPSGRTLLVRYPPG